MRIDFDLGRKLGFAALFGCLMPSVSVAQLAPGVPNTAAPSIEAARDSGGGGLDIGGRFGASLESRVEYTDNFYNTDRNEDDVFGAIVSPKVRYINAVPRFRFAAEATGDFGFFDAVNSNDNYDDFTLSTGANWLPNSRNGFGFGLKYLKQHDPYGTQRTEAPDELSTILRNRDLDEWESFVAELKYIYGGLGSKIQIETGLVGRTKDYTNNRNSPLGPLATTRFLDYDQVGASITTLYVYSPKTAFLFEFVPTHTSFQQVLALDQVPQATVPEDAPSDFFDPSSDEQRYRVGFRWRAAAKTTADLRIGYVTREVDGTFFQDFDGFDFQTQLTWNPVSTDTITVELQRASQETYIAGVALVDNRAYSIDWKHFWTRRLNTRLLFNYVDASFEDSLDGRQDEYGSLAAVAEYQVSRIIKLLASGTYFERDSNVDNVAFDKGSAYIGIRLEP